MYALYGRRRYHMPVYRLLQGLRVLKVLVGFDKALLFHGSMIAWGGFEVKGDVGRRLRSQFATSKTVTH